MLFQLRWCCLLVGLLFSQKGWAQEVFLQIEKVGTPKTTKLGVGQLLEYQLEGEPEWQVGRIEQILPEEQLIVFTNRYVNLEDLAALRHKGPRRWSTPTSASLITFGATWGVLSVFSAWIDEENDPLEVSDAVVAVGAAGLGYLISRLFRYKTIRLNNRHRLRIVDLRVDPSATGF